jgi:spore germination cell wall hydrolase CwlJ-like protein
MVLASAFLCLAANVFFEARGETIPGQYAVALVTMNRADHDPKKVCDVVLKPKQFSWTSLYVQRRRGIFSVKQEYVMQDDDSWALAKRIAGIVLSGRFPDITNGATYYHATYSRPWWRKEVTYRERIGNHLFYAAR